MQQQPNQTRPASAAAARRASTTVAPAPSSSEQRNLSSTQAAAAPRPDAKPTRATGTPYSFVGASNRYDGAWERTFNCEDSDSDLRDFWAIVLEGTSRCKLQVPLAPFVVLDASSEPVFVLQHQATAEKNAETVGMSKVGATGHVEGLHIDGGKSGIVWTAVLQHMRSWPRVAVKRRIASDKGSKELSSTQLLLAQLVSSGSASNPLEVAKTFRQELAAKEHAANIANIMMRLCQQRNEEEEKALRLAEGSIAGRRKKDEEGQKVIQARLRSESGLVIDGSLAEGVAGLKCVVHLRAHPTHHCFCVCKAAL
jgi:hypothetical protein